MGFGLNQGRTFENSLAVKFAALGLLCALFTTNAIASFSQTPQTAAKSHTQTEVVAPENKSEDNHHSWVDGRFKMPVEEQLPGQKTDGPNSAWIIVQPEGEGSSARGAMFVNHRRFVAIKERKKRIFMVLAGENEVSVSTGFRGTDAFEITLAPGESKTVVWGPKHKGLWSAVSSIQCSLLGTK